MDTRTSQDAIMTDALMSNDDSHTREETSFPLFVLPLEIR